VYVTFVSGPNSLTILSSACACDCALCDCGGGEGDGDNDASEDPIVWLLIRSFVTRRAFVPVRDLVN
jgi:hypothetical protein